MALRDEYEFCCDDLPKTSFSFFGNKRTEFCDITFKVGGRSISAHRIILSAAIPFFYEVFSGKGTADAIEKEIAFPDVDSDAFESLIEYAYKYKVKISMENVKMLLSGACTLQVDEVKTACCQFLIDRLNSKNVLEIRNYSSTLDCPELTETIDSFISNNFSEMMMTEEFLNMSFCLLNKLICSDELNVRNEEKVFESALMWVKHCPEERKKNLLDLLKNIRFPFVEPRYIRNCVAKEELIRSSHACRDLVEDATFYHLLPKERKKICSFPTSPRRLLMNDQKSDVKENLSICILLEGGMNVIYIDLVSHFNWKFRKIYGDTIDLLDYHAVVALDKKLHCFLDNVTQIIDLETNCYSSCRGMKYPRNHTGAVAHKNKVFICGGFERGKASNVVKCFAPQTKDICGGFKRGKASNVVECFDPQTKDFAELRCMNTCRGGHSAVAYKEFVYVLGGMSGNDVEYCTNSVEKYNVKTGIWSTSSPMFSPRTSFGCCTVKDKMYVCSGKNENGWISTAEVFDFTTNEWKFIASMKNPMTMCKLIFFCNKVHAVGSTSSVTTNLAVNVYEEKTDYWHNPLTWDRNLLFVAAVPVALPPL